MGVMTEDKFKKIVDKLHKDITSGNTGKIDNALNEIGYHQDRLNRHIEILEGRVSIPQQEKNLKKVKLFLGELEGERAQSTKKEEQASLGYTIGWIKKAVEKEETGLKLAKDYHKVLTTDQARAMLAKKKSMLERLDNYNSIALANKSREKRRSMDLKKMEENKTGFFRKRYIRK
jgi:hypothetical protein